MQKFTTNFTTNYHLHRISGKSYQVVNYCHSKGIQHKHDKIQNKYNKIDRLNFALIIFDLWAKQVTTIITWTVRVHK